MRYYYGSVLNGTDKSDCHLYLRLCFESNDSDIIALSRVLMTAWGRRSRGEDVTTDRRT